MNCCSPLLIRPLLDTVSPLRSPDQPWVVYPNSGEEWDRLSGSVLMLLLVALLVHTGSVLILLLVVLLVQGQR